MTRFLSAVVNLFTTTFLRAERPPVFFTNEGALRGYDPGSYFLNGAPKKGSALFSYTYTDTIWHFMSAENVSTFRANPRLSIPQFGGYCSYGMANGYKADTQLGDC